MSERIKFNRETFAFLFRKIFYKATRTKKQLTDQEIISHIRSIGKTKFFANKSSGMDEDGCYLPPPESKPGVFDLDLEQPPLRNNLKTWILEDKGVQQILFARYHSKKLIKRRFYTKYGYQGRRLHDLYTILFEKDDKQSQSSDRDYADIFLKYAGYNSIEELEGELAEKASNHLTPEEEIIHYKGYFFNYSKHCISEFDMNIDYVGYPHFAIEQNHFHNLPNQPPFKGIGKLSNDGKIFASLHQKGNSKEFKIIIDSGGNPKAEPAMICSIQTISTYYRVISVEAIILKKELIATHPEYVRDINRYLFLHRYCFRLKKPPLNLISLKARRINVKAIDQMIGVFRVWRFDEDFNLIQSKIVIDDNYMAMCFTKQYEGEQENYNTQYCTLKVTDHQGNSSLCITTHPRKSIEIISQMVIKVFDKNSEYPPKITGGVITLTNHQQNFASGRAIVMMKEDSLSFELETIEKDKIGAYIENDRDLVMLFTTLVDIQKSMSINSWFDDPELTES